MSIEKAVFYFLSTLVIFAGSMVVIAKNPVKAVLFLVLTFFSAAGLWVLLEAQFLAMTLVLVYVGAVMVLFLFVVMMLDVEFVSIRAGFARYFPLGLSVALITILGLVWAVSSEQVKVSLFNQTLPKPHPLSYSDVEAIGKLLYGQYLYAFEIAGVILLVAIISAISLTFRGRRGNKAPDPGWQISVNKEDRVRLVKMESTKEFR